MLATLQFSPEPFDSASDRAPEEPLRSLRESDWRTALGFADNSRLTLLLGDRGRSQLPTSVRKRIEGNLETNRVRLRRLTDDYMRIADRLAAGGVELWSQILQENPRHTLQWLDKFAKVLDQFRRAIEHGDQEDLVDLLNAGKQKRDSVGN